MPSSTLTVEPPNRGELVAEQTALVAEVERELGPIETPAAYLARVEDERRVSQCLERIKPPLDEHCATLRRGLQEALDIRSGIVKPLETLKSRLRELLGAYTQREEASRRETARLIAEEELEEQRERQQHEARLLESQGQAELAAAIRARPVEIAPLELPTAVPEVAGLSYRVQWGWSPVGGDTPENRKRALSLLVRADYVMFLKFDDAGLTTFAQRTKGTIRVPGIVFSSRNVPVRRSGG